MLIQLVEQDEWEPGDYIAQLRAAFMRCEHPSQAHGRRSSSDAMRSALPVRELYFPNPLTRRGLDFSGPKLGKSATKVTGSSEVTPRSSPPQLTRTP